MIKQKIQKIIIKSQLIGENLLQPITTQKQPKMTKNQKMTC